MPGVSFLFIALNIVTIDPGDGSLRAIPFRWGNGLFSIVFMSLHDSFSIPTYLTSTVELFDESISFGFVIEFFLHIPSRLCLHWNPKTHVSRYSGPIYQLGSLPVARCLYTGRH